MTEHILKPAFLVAGVMFIALGIKNDLIWAELLGSILLGAFTAI